METNKDFALNAPYIQNRVQTAIERVTADPALTETLADDEAITLLHWAETEIEWLVLETVDMDDEAAWQYLDPAMRKLRRFIRDTANTSAETDDPAVMLHLLLAAAPTYTDET
jgi:hypothetical protein